MLLHTDVVYAFSITSTRHWMSQKCLQFMTSASAASVNGVDDDLIQSIQTATSGTPKLQFEKLFHSFAKNSYFVSHVWQQKPYYVNQPLDCVVGAYTMDDVRQAVDSDFLEAGRGTFQSDRGGWNMAAVSTVNKTYSLRIITMYCIGTLQFITTRPFTPCHCITFTPNIHYSNSLGEIVFRMLS